MTNIGTRYEVAYITETATIALGFIARHSAVGILDYVQGDDVAQAIVAGLPEDVEVARKGPAWIVSRAGAVIGRFAFTGNTERHRGI